MLAFGSASASEPARFTPQSNARPISASASSGNVLRWRSPKSAAEQTSAPEASEPIVQNNVRAASVQFAAQQQPRRAQPSGWNVTRAGTRAKFANNDLLENPFGESQAAFQQEEEPIEPLTPPMTPPMAPPVAPAAPRRTSPFLPQPQAPEAAPAEEMPERPEAPAPAPARPEPSLDPNEPRSESDRPNEEPLPSPSPLRQRRPSLAKRTLPGCEDRGDPRRPYACAHPEGLKCLPNDFLDISPRYADLRRLREEMNQGGFGVNTNDDILEKVFGEPGELPPASSELRRNLRNELRTWRRPPSAAEGRRDALAVGRIIDLNSEQVVVENAVGGRSALPRRDLHPDDEALLRSLEPHRYRTRSGRVVADGYVGPIRQGRVTIVDEADRPVGEVPFNDLGGEELNIVARFWQLPGECLVQDFEVRERDWVPSTFTFTASALCHKPLYFEQPQIERYGHSSGPVFQPLISMGKFGLDFVTLPYKMAINPPNECQYTLGYYRPGSCAPYMIPPIPLSMRGALAQAGIIVGGIYIIP